MKVHRLGQGAVLSFTLFSFYRLLNARFPLDMVSALILVLPLLGMAGALAWRAETRRGTARARSGRTITFGIVATLFMLATATNSKISLHFLASTNYYPYPRPEGEIGHWVLLALSLSLSAPLFGKMAAGWGEQPGQGGSAEFFWGLAGGWALAHAVILVLGAPMALGIGVLAALALHARPSVAIAGALLIVVSGLALRTRPPALLTWRVTDYRILEQKWTENYFLNFVSFRDDHCLAGIYSFLMLWQVCDDTSYLQKEQRAFHRAVGAGKDSALILGRADGTTPLTLESVPGQFKRVVAVEIDPVVVDRMTGVYARYNQGVFSRPGHRAVAMDWRQFIERDDQRYDIVMLDGLGIRLITEPLSVVFHEDSVYTRESFETIFNERLEPDGILALNWGSSLEYEAIPLIENFPPDVHRAVFWTTFNDFPFMGLPVFLIAASRDRATVERVAAELRLNSTFKEIAVPDTLTPRNTDDSPFLQRFIQLYKLAYPLLLVVLCTTALVGWRHRRQDERGGVWPFAIGVGLGIGLCVLAARGSRWVSEAGPGVGFLWLGLTVLISGGAAAWLDARKAPAESRIRLRVAMVIAASASVVGSMAVRPEFLLIAAAGLGAGSAIIGNRLVRTPSAAALLVLGWTAGLLICQFGPYSFGYAQVGAAGAAVLLILGAHNVP